MLKSAQHSQCMVAIALKLQDGIYNMLECARSGELPIFCDMPD